ncbi:MAG: thiamine diphosphokinase [Anaerostipes sp.]|nr:thiamine diphosphokinase [Anaerostipes sp.]
MVMHILILTGGELDRVFARSYIQTQKFDKIIAADKGLLYAEQIKIRPDFILGDFDSCPEETVKRFKQEDIMILPREKDDTDTGIAVEQAVRMGATKVTILGSTGTRLDHVLGNMGQLVYALKHGVEAYIVDSHNRIRAVDRPLSINKKEQFGNYISLIPVGTVTGVTLHGFYYPLNDDTLVFHETWGISNELAEETGKIEMKTGTLLVIESKD